MEFCAILCDSGWYTFTSAFLVHYYTGVNNPTCRCLLVHGVRFFHIHRHRLFTEDVFAGLEHRHDHWIMQGSRSDDAHEVEPVKAQHLVIIGKGTWDAKFARGRLSSVDVAIAHREQFDAGHAPECGDLPRPCKRAAANYADANPIRVD